MKYAIRIANAPFPVWVEAIYPEGLIAGLGFRHFYTDFPRRATLYSAVEVAIESQIVKDPIEIITEDELQVYIIMGE